MPSPRPIVFRRSAGLVWLFLALSSTAPSGAAPGADFDDTISADRPGEAEAPTTVGRGIFQIEGGIEFEREPREPDADGDELTLPLLLLRIGVMPNVELRLAADGFIYQDDPGSEPTANGSDFVLGAKWRLFPQSGWIPMTGLLASLSFPTGSDPVTSGGYDPTGSVLFQWSVGERATVDANLVFRSETSGHDDSTRFFEFRPAFSLDLALLGPVHGFVEYFGKFAGGGRSDQHSIDGGFTWLVNDDLQLDLNAGVGLNDAAPRFFVGAGASWRFRFTGGGP